jgi:hypothetical protein
MFVVLLAISHFAHQESLHSELNRSPDLPTNFKLRLAAISRVAPSDRAAQIPSIRVA